MAFEEDRLALFLILARIAYMGLRLSAVRWAEQHAVSDILDLEAFDENDLYAAMDWLAVEQTRIEQQLYQRYVEDNGTPPAIVLYDATSSYFEGEQNELATYGYNRDGKKGKLQIVIGLLSGADGEPLAVRVFEGNTADPNTVATQIELLKQQFGVAEVVFIGDRGMLKAIGKAALLDGCYVLETTVPSVTMDRHTIDERYRDLQQVERNFRTMKTDFLEVRPIFLRNGERTKAHVFVAMLALKITRRFQSLLHQAFGTTGDDPLAMTPDDALQALSRLTCLIYDVKGSRYARLIQPDDEQRTLLDALGLRFPRQTAKAL